MPFTDSSGHSTMSATAQIDLAKTYFRKVDLGDAGLFDLFTEDVQIFFPKYGLVNGKTEAAGLVTALTGVVVTFRHAEEGMVFTQSGDRLVVEGFESGITADGTEWPDDVVSQGRYCNVFEFREGLISRVHIYVDPDFTSADTERILRK